MIFIISAGCRFRMQIYVNVRALMAEQCKTIQLYLSVAQRSAKFKLA